MTRKRRILIAAVAVAGILFVGWKWNNRAAALAHQLRIGQTQEEVAELMGPPAERWEEANSAGYGWKITRLMDVFYPPKDRYSLNSRYEVAIWFDDEGKVIAICCPSAAIDLF